MNILYQIVVFLSGLLLPFFGILNPKINQMLKGRSRAFDDIKKFKNSTTDDIVWFHMASLGEFEQARPLIDKFFHESDKRVVLSFFSPSGYEIRKTYDKADFCFYLPADSISNAKKLIKYLNPKIVIWVKYDIWHNIINIISKHHIPIFLVCADFRQNQYYFKSGLGFFKRTLMSFNKIFCLNVKTHNLLKDLGFKNLELSGDLRIDSVIERKNESSALELINRFQNGEKLLVFGSTHQSDADIIRKLSYKFEGKIIIAPHQVNGKHLNWLKANFSDHLLLSIASNETESRIMIVDTIGTLFDIYRNANLVYIGGGFDSGIHNILEPGVFGKSIIIGPKFKKFTEAVELKKRGLISVIKKLEDIDHLDLNELVLSPNKHGILAFFDENSGHTQNVYNTING